MLKLYQQHITKPNIFSSPKYDSPQWQLQVQLFSKANEAFLKDGIKFHAIHHANLIYSQELCNFHCSMSVEMTGFSNVAGTVFPKSVMSGLALGGMVGGPACGRGLEIHDPWGPFQPWQFCDSVILSSSAVESSLGHFSRQFMLWPHLQIGTISEFESTD